MNSNLSVETAGRVRSILRDSGIGVCLEWVKQSIEYLSRKGPLQHDPKAIASQVYTLFLDSDLHEIASEEGTLPANAAQIESGMLSSSATDDLLILQVDETVNIGSSAAFRNSRGDEEAEPLKGPAAGNSRMLKLYLTDGRQQIVGLEYRPMSSLSLELAPGTKVKLRANCTPMRRGVVLLSRDCLVLLEGSVERLSAVGPTEHVASVPIPQLQRKDKEAILPQHAAEKLPAQLEHQVQRPQLQLQAQQPQQPVWQQQQQQIHQVHKSSRVNAPSSVCLDADRSNNIGAPYSGVTNHYSNSDAEPDDNNHPAVRGDQGAMLAVLTPRHARSSALDLGGVMTDDGVLDLCSPPSPIRPQRREELSASDPVPALDLTVHFPDSPAPTVSPVLLPDRHVTAAATIADDPMCIVPSGQDEALGVEGVDGVQGPLRYVTMSTIKAAEAMPSTTDSLSALQGEFLFRGTAVHIKRFKVTAAEGYVVNLILEEDESEYGLDPDREKMELYVLLSGDLSAKYLNMPAGEFIAQQKMLKKEASKAFKMDWSLKFRDFRGTFRAKSLLPKGVGLGDSGATSNETKNDGTLSQGAEAASLLLLDFYVPDD